MLIELRETEKHEGLGFETCHYWPFNLNTDPLFVDAVFRLLYELTISEESKANQGSCTQNSLRRNISPGSRFVLCFIMVMALMY